LSYRGIPKNRTVLTPCVKTIFVQFKTCIIQISKSLSSVSFLIEIMKIPTNTGLRPDSIVYFRLYQIK